MFYKWIVCNVKENLRKEFSEAQEKWVDTKNASGFIGQVGGWDLKNKNTAYILSIWNKKESLNIFIKNVHDKIFYKNKQSQFYNSISILYYQSLDNMETAPHSLIDALKNGRIIRVSIIKLKEVKRKHFEKTQKEGFFSTKDKTDGVLSTNFLKAADKTPNYLIITFAESSENPNSFMNNKLQKIQEIADVNNDIVDMKTRFILLVDSWRIIK